MKGPRGEVERRGIGGQERGRSRVGKVGDQKGEWRYDKPVNNDGYAEKELCVALIYIYTAIDDRKKTARRR